MIFLNLLIFLKWTESLLLGYYQILSFFYYFNFDYDDEITELSLKRNLKHE